MTSLLIQLIIWLNIIANTIGSVLLGFIAAVPGWLSNTIISAVVGVFFLFLLKYCSNQKAIGNIRSQISANLLALKLFKDSMIVTFKAQGQLFKYAFLLFVNMIFPMLVGLIPFCLIVTQMSLWYEFRPLQVGEETLATVKLKNDSPSSLPNVSLAANDAFEIVTGPVRAVDINSVYYTIKAVKPGRHDVIVETGGVQFAKSISIGDGFMRISTERPAMNFSDIFLYPAEKPLAADSLVQSIRIDYPDRPGLISGAGWWMIYFIVVSIIFALIFKPFLNVKI